MMLAGERKDERRMAKVFVMTFCEAIRCSRKCRPRIFRRLRPEELGFL